MNLDFNTDYPIRAPVELRASTKSFFGPDEKKDKWIYEQLPKCDLFLFATEITESMIVHLAGFLVPLFGWKTVKIQDAFPDATYQDLNTGDIIRAEFEKRTRDFIEHEHHKADADCDLIICWEDNLTEKEKAEYLFTKNAELKIIELKKIFFHYDFELRPTN
jgi:hypothetical protein